MISAVNSIEPEGQTTRIHWLLWLYTGGVGVEVNKSVPSVKMIKQTMHPFFPISSIVIVDFTYNLEILRFYIGEGFSRFNKYVLVRIQQSHKCDNKELSVCA